MAILKIAPPPISETTACRAKISSISTSWCRKRVGTCIYVQLLKLWPMDRFHAQMWQFWKWACISETTAHRAKISSISTSWCRKRVNVQLLALWPMVNCHAQIWQFWKSACVLLGILCPIRAPVRSISTPWGRKRVYVQLLVLWSMAKLYHAQIWQFWKSSCISMISETAAHRVKISSLLTPWGRRRVYVQLLDFGPVSSCPNMAILKIGLCLAWNPLPN